MAQIKFNRFQREAKRKPVEIELPDGDTIVIPIPNGDTMCDVEEAGTTRKTLRLLMSSDDYGKLQPLLSTIQDPTALREFITEILDAFGMGPNSSPPEDGPRSSS